MIKISVLGHSPDSFPDIKSIAFDIDNAIEIIKLQHAQEKDITFLLNCDPGIGQWVCNAITEKELPYEVYLTSAPEEASFYWSEEQQTQLFWQLKKAKALHICCLDNSFESRIIRDKQMIDESQWVLAFWISKHQGETFQSIQYAVSNGKIVYNGIGRLKLIDSDELRIQDR